MTMKRSKTFGCSYCDKFFNLHNQLVVHTRQHTGERPFECRYCLKCFASIKVLKVHERIHTGEKPYKCPYCEKCFSAYANLVVHRRIHTNEKLYQCKLCKRSFEHSGNLSRHFRAHLTDHGFRCILCSQLFDEEYKLLEHTKEDHKNEYISYIMKTKPSALIANLPSTSGVLHHFNASEKIDNPLSRGNAESNIILPNDLQEHNVCASDEISDCNLAESIIHFNSVKSQPSFSLHPNDQSSEYEENPESNYFPHDSYHTLNTLDIDHKPPKFDQTNLRESSAFTEYKKLVNTSNAHKSHPSENYNSSHSCSSREQTEFNCEAMDYTSKEASMSFADPPPLIPIDEIDLDEPESCSTFDEGHKGSEMDSTISYFDIYGKAIDSDIDTEHFRSKHKILVSDILSNQSPPSEQTEDGFTETKDLITKNSIKKFFASQLRIFAFRRKVERALCALVGKDKLKEFGYPHRSCEQVLIQVLDSIDKTPCADVRVLELDRFKINVRILIEKTFPDKKTWEKLGWRGKSTEFILDQIIAYES